LNILFLILIELYFFRFSSFGCFGFQNNLLFKICLMDWVKSMKDINLDFAIGEVGCREGKKELMKLFMQNCLFLKIVNVK
jgi:hypothetical protein